MNDFDPVETKANNHVAGRVTTTDGAKLWVDVHGVGRPILFVHGWTMSNAFWRRQIALADEFQIVTLDLRGHGRSDSILRGHNLPRYARDVRQVINALGLKRVLLAGWSMGGSVVLEYWNQYGSDKLSGLALIEASPAPFSDGPWNNHALRGSNVGALDESLQFLASHRQAHAKRFVDEMFMTGEAPSHARRWMVAESLKTSVEPATTIYRDYVARDYTALLPRVNIPALAVYGRSRHMCFGASTGRYVAGSLPQSRFVVLENSGHLPFYEEPDLFNDTLGAFARKL